MEANTAAVDNAHASTSMQAGVNDAYEGTCTLTEPNKKADNAQAENIEAYEEKNADNSNVTTGKAKKRVVDDLDGSSSDSNEGAENNHAERANEEAIDNDHDYDNSIDSEDEDSQPTKQKKSRRTDNDAEEHREIQLQELRKQSADQRAEALISRERREALLRSFLGGNVPEEVVSGFLAPGDFAMNNRNMAIYTPQAINLTNEFGPGGAICLSSLSSPNVEAAAINGGDGMSFCSLTKLLTPEGKDIKIKIRLNRRHHN